MLVLENGERRIELHVRALDDEAWALVALAGDPQGQPSRHRCQGPYTQARQAEAALRAIAAILLEQGYRSERCWHPVWGVNAQGLIKRMRNARQASTGNEQFDPEPHEPLW